MIPKFRFFDTEENEMHVVDSLYTFKSFGGKDITIATEDIDLSEWRSYSDGVLMQSTGLLDKNGKEIYEGDVIHLTSNDGIDYKALIIFREGGFCAVDGVEDDYVTRRYQLYKSDCELEIIGNKFTHPHLLEEE